ncbi:fimbrial protein [Dyella sp. S184]|jgi:type 1 fimbria pilin|uniref:fimbrial protein n=1 Tax=Dyella sp. S184 TaxID=1641862 RepID=UPI00131DCEF1|nr:fimbrial protein [Dyella sp. S184]
MKIRPDKAQRFSWLLGWGLFVLTGWATLTVAATVSLTTTAPVRISPQTKVQTQTKAKAKGQTIGPVQTTNCTASSATLSLPGTVYISPNAPNGVLPYPAGTATIVFTCVGLPATTNHPADYEAQIQAGDTLATLSTANVPAGPGITFALPKLTGLALLVTATPVQATSQACLACGPASTAGYVPGNVTAPAGTAQGTYSGTVTATYTAQLYKTGTVKVGTQSSINLIPFWWYISGGSVDSSSALLNANLVMPAITVVASTCNITSPTVTLPTVSTAALQAGQVAGSTAFSITMTGCQSASPDAVSVFSGSGIDTTTGYLKNTGTATNVEVQLLNGAGSTSQTAGTPILLDQAGSAQNSGTYNITSGNATLNYYAQYVAINGAAAGAGTVKSTVAFTIYYP